MRSLNYKKQYNLNLYSTIQRAYMSYNGRLTSLSHGGGCGCKIAPGVLSEILKSTPFRQLPTALLAGSEKIGRAHV